MTSGGMALHIPIPRVIWEASNTMRALVQGLDNTKQKNVLPALYKKWLMAFFDINRASSVA